MGRGLRALSSCPSPCDMPPLLLFRTSLVPAAHVLEVEAIHSLEAVHPRRHVVSRLLRAVVGVVGAVDERARVARHVLRKGPGQAVELDARVASLGLLDEEPLVARLVVGRPRVVHVTRLTAIGALSIAAHLHLRSGGTARGARSRGAHTQRSVSVDARAGRRSASGHTGARAVSVCARKRQRSHTHLEDVQRGAVLGLEEQVEDGGAHGLRVVANEN